MNLWQTVYTFQMCLRWVAFIQSYDCRILLLPVLSALQGLHVFIYVCESSCNESLHMTSDTQWN